MAISTYAELKTAVAAWLVRDDLTTVIPDFITLAEAGFNRALQAREMEAIISLSTSGGSASLPDDYIHWRRLAWETDTPVELDYRHPSYLRGAFPTDVAGSPQIFTIEAGNFVIRPVADSDSYTLDYYQRIPALSDSATTNWLLTAYPDAYLFGTLVEAQAYVIDAEKASLWKLRRDEVLAEIQALSNLSQGGGRQMPIGWIV